MISMKFLIPKPRNSDLDILGHPRNLSDNNNATILNFNSYTLYNAILRIARNFLETRENIKILTHPFYHINLG